MARIEIDMQVSGRSDAALILRHIAKEIEGGFWAGEGWDFEDDEEEEFEEDEEE